MSFGCDKAEKTNDESKNQNQTEKKSNNNDKNSIIQNVSGEISANLNINKKPIHKMVPVVLKLDLKFGKKSAEKANILMDLTMPAMAMPKNEVKLTESLPGIYSGEAIFTMSGDWRLMTYVNYGGKKYDMYFDIKVE